MRFGIDEQHVVCVECGEAEAIQATSDVAPLRRAEARAVQPFTSGINRSPHHHAPQTRDQQIQEITCPTCGGDEIFVGTLASTSCPFCAGELLRSDAHQLVGDLRVDGIIPFQITEAETRAAIKRWVKKQRLAPDSFSADSVVETLQSVYLGAYLFDLTTLTTFRGERGDIYRDHEGNEKIKWTGQSGTKRDQFGNAVVIASDRISPIHSAALYPWPFPNVRDFDPGFLAGHLSHTVDRQPEACIPEAVQVIDDKVVHSIKMVIGGDKQRVNSKGTIVESASQRHLLVPVWMSTLQHNGNTHHVVVNGATGAVSGDAPTSKLKIALYATLVLFVIVSLVIGVMTLMSTVGVADGVALS